VSCRPLSPCEPGSSCCRAGALKVKQATGGHLVAGWANSAHRRPRRRSHPACTLSSGAARRARSRLHGCSAMDRPSAVWAAHRPGCAGTVAVPGRLCYCAHGPHTGFSLLARGKIKFSFLFLFSLNFENSYLSVQSSKNYETSSIGFIIL
jgi:hypothetical protein